jgi:hypothetical protein
MTSHPTEGTRITLMSTWHKFLAKNATGEARLQLLAGRKAAASRGDKGSHRRQMAEKARQRKGSQWQTNEENKHKGGYGVCVFRQKFTLEDATGSHACSLEALTCV